MSEKEIFNLSPEDTQNVSGGKSLKTGTPGVLVGGPGGIWRPKCEDCGKEMPGGKGVVRLRKNGAAEDSYICTECAEKLLNSGKATIAPGYENHYEKYKKSMNETTGEIWYGWRQKIE